MEILAILRMLACRSLAISRASSYYRGMKLIVNGETKESPSGATVSDLIEAVGLTGRAVAVEVNRKIVTKADQQTATLNEGDEVELVTLVGGG